MSDVATFTSFAAHGLYSGPTFNTISPPYAGVTSAWATYFAGEMLSAYDFSATPTLVNISKVEFQKARKCTLFGDLCEDTQGIAYYWSSVTQMAYTINEPQKWALYAGKTAVIEKMGYEATAYGLFEFLETTEVYMPVFFDGAYNCTLEGKAGGPVISINTDGTLDVACLSSLPIYLAKGASCPEGAVNVGGKCPFGFMG